MVHSIARQGFGEGTNEVYDRAHPSYPSSVLSHIRQSIAKERSPPFNIVEIGAGTGIFTRALLAHPEWATSIAEVRAVEPSAGMRAQFGKTVVSDGNVTISVKDGSFTDTGIESGWADMVVMAQAYHWVHPAYDEASKEFGRILKSSGIVVYVWYLENQDAEKWMASVREMYEKYEGDAPQFPSGLWRATFDPKVSPVYPTLFEQPVEESSFEWVIPTTVDAVIGRVQSKSYIVVPVEREKKQEFDRSVQEIRETLNKEEKKWTDKEAGIFECPYKTTLIIASKK